MKAKELSDDLALQVRERVLELLGKPYAGSKAFRYNHPDARYVSTCHGAMAYVFGLEDPIVKERTHPSEISPTEMVDLIEGYFIPSEVFEVGNLIAFYETSGDDETLVHTALLTGEDGKMFEQSGRGWIFQPKTIEEKVRSLPVPKSSKIEVKSYRLSA